MPSVFVVQEDGHREGTELADAKGGISLVDVGNEKVDGGLIGEGAYNWRHMPQGDAGRCRQSFIWLGRSDEEKGGGEVAVRTQ